MDDVIATIRQLSQTDELAKLFAEGGDETAACCGSYCTDE